MAVANNRKVALITGAAGHIGVRLAEYLSAIDACTLRLAVRQHQTTPLSDFGDVISGDLQDKDFCRVAAEGCDVIIHLASVPTQIDDSSTAVATHESMITNLLNVATATGVSRFVHMSSIHVYGNNLHGRIDESTPCDPVTPYGKAHLRTEQLVQSFEGAGMTRLSLRCGNGFGSTRSLSQTPWSLVTADLCHQAVRGQTLRLNTHGQHRRDFVTVTDIVRAIHHFSINSGGTDVVLLGSGKSLTLHQFALLVAARANLMFGHHYSVVCNDRDVSTPIEYQLDVRKLHDYGFQPTNDFDTEIDELLTAATARNGR